MAELQDVVLRLRMGHGVRNIQRSIGVHRTMVRRIREIAEARGWLERSSELPSEAEIEQARSSGGGRKEGELLRERLDAHREEFKRWSEEGMSCVVMHQLIRDRVPCSLSTVDRYLKRELPARVEAVMRRATVPGQVMEVDFGYLGLTWDAKSGRRRRTWVFSGRLRHSRRAWREMSFDQTQRTFFLCHIHAFEHFGGVAARLVPDNLKAAVVKASFEDPIINRAYRALARHYQALVDPCAPYEPKHKGGVESDIKYIKRNFWPLFRERERRLGQEVPRADELQEHLERWSAEVADRRIVGGVGRTPRELFETEEARALTGLPATRWDPLSWAEPAVGPDWRVQFEKGYYTVPCGLIGKRVLVYGDTSRVRIYHGTEEIALHERVEHPWQVRSKPEHAPPGLQEWIWGDRTGLLRWARRLGEPVGKVAEAILADKVVDGVRPVRALIRLADGYSVQRLGAACRRALLYETPSYRSIKEILKAGLDRLPLCEPSEPSGQLAFRFQRERGYFDPEQHVS